MQKWEYIRAEGQHGLIDRIGETEHQNLTLDGYLWQAGEDGWELLTFTMIEDRFYMIFKRPKS